ncbi:MAG: Acylamidase [Pseudomonas citronellolis]|nr:MAG: Acylamidase [Pseudomonas citronellolis]
MTEPTALSASALSAAIAAGELSCVAVMQAYLARIERLNPQYNALVSLRPRAELLAEARQCDAELARGQRRGWLHGIPQAPKDMLNVAGLPTTYGSPLFADNLARQDDPLAQRLREAGAIFLGKSNTPEFALGSSTYNRVFGITRNAHDPRLSAGGSSGGAASAVALGLLPVADASDMMGSIRNPAAFNGLYGLRPTPGLIATGANPEPGVAALATHGVLARDAEDLHRLLQTLSGQTFDLPTRSAPPRIGWLGDLGGYLALEDGIASGCQQGLSELFGAAAVQPISLDLDLPVLWQAWQALRASGLATRLRPLLDDPQKRSELKPELLWEVQLAEGLDSEALATADYQRASLYSQLLTAFERHDLLALPSTQVFPFAAELHWPERIGARGLDSYYRWMEVSLYASLAGCPVLNLPLSDPSGRRLGVQLIAPRHAEARLLAVAAEHQRRAGAAIAPVGDPLT